MRRSTCACLLFGLFVATASPGIGSEMIGPVEVTTAVGDNRFLDYHLTVPAPIDSVWSALTTSEGLASWAGPAAHVELRRGGAWDVYFKPDAPPGERGSENTIIAVVSGELLVIEAGAPAQFPRVKREKTIAIFRIAEISPDSTLVRMTQTGWRSGEQWDAAFTYLAEANAQWLGWLHKRFASGPIDWNSMAPSDAE